MRPHVLVNVAVSADGKLSSRERRQIKISGSDDFERVDIIKADTDAIMVGIGTVLADDPSLTVKSVDRIRDRINSGKPEHPIRIIIDSKARTPPEAKILHKGLGKRIIFVSHAAPGERIAALQPYAEIITAGEKEVDLTAVMELLGIEGVKKLMVEGGGTLIAGLFNAGLVDQLSMYIGSIIIGGTGAPTLADGPGWIQEHEFTRLELIHLQQVDDGVLIDWRVKT
ncbi:MAG: 2,5-diamino-6-(ribosylamino)-4(3H)-pyrimidinone 5'-phosphate reductase [Methanospirillum sp.]|uniref:2,5-diamino-6-(ribosylamino)-4(3H)-pyrimidinone 5'-phosphate reductase n=1 Tax=Methanospirillum sp. TaxID=45200 RepID=UPI00236DA676|nr:2,5-diamino-6-(ribosylamino)-4(3H)-pyrimidinone 5'-phosphate reductase [Methanospirillum sp.]MDD1729378.1 2,5-diamino-6-(ribosylamino)-4(3H)-pyrimidinone 5'-phosphate reductase [Methanospirillum sp.]